MSRYPACEEARECQRVDQQYPDAAHLGCCGKRQLHRGHCSHGRSANFYLTFDTSSLQLMGLLQRYCHSLSRPHRLRVRPPWLFGARCHPVTVRYISFSPPTQEISLLIYAPPPKNQLSPSSTPSRPARRCKSSTRKVLSTASGAPEAMGEPSVASPSPSCEQPMSKRGRGRKLNSLLRGSGGRTGRSRTRRGHRRRRWRGS